MIDQKIDQNLQEIPEEVKQEGKIKAIRVYVVHGDGSEGLSFQYSY